MKRKQDKYDRAIAILKEHPDQIMKAWNFPGSPTTPHPEAEETGCLFMYAGDENHPTFKYDTHSFNCGCLTQVRDLHNYVAQNPTLTKAIRADKRLPKSSSDITVKHLKVFAEWQRKLDRYKFRRASSDLES